MKAYLVTTGIIFALIGVTHILRVFAEGPRLAKDPFFILVTLLTFALSVWAWRLLRNSVPPQPPVRAKET